MTPLKQYGRYGSVGIELILSMVLGYLGGHWLDKKLGTNWLTWVGALIGVYAGFRSLFVTARKMQRDIELEEREEAARKPYVPPALPLLDPTAEVDLQKREDDHDHHDDD